MKTNGWAGLIGTALLGVSTAQVARAEVVTFDDLAPNIFFAGESFNSGSFQFTAEWELGVVDTAEAFFFGNAPTNAVDQFYAGLNDGGVTIRSSSGPAWYLQGLDFGFIPPLPLDGEGIFPGYLIAEYVTADGKTGFEFWGFSPSDPDGLFAFDTLGMDDLGDLRGLALSSLTFYACVIYDDGDCYNPADNLAQFALDNISARVPEPATLGLFLLGLGLAAGARRRRH